MSAIYADLRACGSVGILLLAEKSVVSMHVKFEYYQVSPADTPSKAIKTTKLFMLVYGYPLWSRRTDI